jgi:hypothetical protein
VRLLGAAHASISLVSALKKTMKKRKVNRIYVSLVGLQVIAFMKNLIDVQMLGRRIEKLVIRKQRRFSRSHVGENGPSGFFTGVRGMPNSIPMRAAAQLPRLLQTTPINVIEPTMIKAPEAAGLDSPVA